MFWEEICCRRRYVTRGDMLLEKICCPRRYVAGGDAMLKRVSSQRRYLVSRVLYRDLLWFNELT